MNKKRQQMEKQSLCSNIVHCLNLFQGDVSTNHVRSFKIPGQNIIYGEIIIQVPPGKSGPGKPASVQLYSASDIDPDTGRGRLTEKVLLKHGNVDKGLQNESGAKVLRYDLEFNVEPDFGNPGALVIKNELKHKFFLQSASIHVYNDQNIHFECNSWIYPFRLTKQDRIFFSNTCYLPNQTPVGLMKLRNEELRRLRGDGSGERQEWDQIYDYDYYNTLGISINGLEYHRPVLGGSKSFPYPRRLRTGRPPNNHDTHTENQAGKWFGVDSYVPPDEQFSRKKLYEFTSNVVRGARQFVSPEARSMVNEESSEFESFDQIHRLFASNRSHSVDEWLMEVFKRGLPHDLFKKVKKAMEEKTVEFQLPRIARGDTLAWMDDNEFGRQMLAGTNPTVISSLQSFPPKGENGVESSINLSDIEHNLDCLTVSEALNQWRIFQLDHHDYLMPFLRRINRRNGVFAYASRTLLFLRDDSTLKPLAIELSLPGSSPNEEINRVFHPAPNGTQAALWQLAKAHVAAVDSGYHQLVNHWCLEDGISHAVLSFTCLRQFIQDLDHMESRPMGCFKHVIRIQSAGFPVPTTPIQTTYSLVTSFDTRVMHCVIGTSNVTRLKTHAVVEPFIIATRRRLSVMHPIHRLLNPHFKDTIQANALARSMVANAEGILEKTLFSGKISMEMSAFLYRSWRFDEQSLPSDLIKRGMAVYNPNRPENIELVIEDYPYGADGLDIWIAIKNWVRQYCLYFYEDDDSLRSDNEIKEWWSEVRYMGHGDKYNETWWPAMTNRVNLIEALTTLIWIVSALHAALTLGQYDYAGYPLNRTAKCRKPIPYEGTIEFAEFLTSPDRYFLSMLPEKFEMGLGIALVDVLSRCTNDETWLGQQVSEKWIDDEKIHRMFKRFGAELEEVEKRIRDRNQDPKLKNRRGRAGFRYEVFCPETSEVGSSDGILRSGIPNSAFL